MAKELAVEETSIEEKINSFADQLEAEYLTKYNAEKENGNEEANKESISSINYYQTFVFRMVNNFEMSMSDVYIVDSEIDGKHQIKIYRDEKDQETGAVYPVLLATVNEKGEIEFTNGHEHLNEKVANQNLEEVLEANEGKVTAELTQETKDLAQEEVNKGDLTTEEVAELKKESKDDEELKAKLELKIRPGTEQVLANSEMKEFPDFKGHNNIACGYSKADNPGGYIAYDKSTGEVLMGPAVTNTRTITKQSPEGEITTERHYAMMPSRRDPNKMMTVQIGAYGERIYNEADRTSEGQYVARQIDVRGKTQNSKKLRESMNKKETRENMGETAEELQEMGVNTKKNVEWKMNETELEEFKYAMRKQMGPCTDAELMRRFQVAANKIKSNEITLKMVVAQAKADYAREQIEHNESVRNGEGKGFGEEREDPRMHA